MTKTLQDFDLGQFLPYLLNQAAEATSRSFQAAYRSDFGMSRTQWRVLANLGKFGAMTAADICRRSHMEKTLVSRAVANMDAAGLLQRETAKADRRAEYLTLTPQGQQLFAKLGQRAKGYDQSLRMALGPEAATVLEATLRRLIAMGAEDGENVSSDIA